MEGFRQVAVAVTASLAVALMACGGTDSSGSTGSTGSTTTKLWVVPDSASRFTASQITDFGNGNLYYNAHTSANPGGAIRGQLDKAGTLKLAVLDAGQETPATTSTAFGAGALIVDEATGKLAGFVVTSGLVSPTAAHIHQGARGSPGSIIVPLTGGPEVWVVPDGQAPLTAAQISAFQAGNLYFNVHTSANAGGEIRGQIDKGGAVRVASLGGSQETPATASTGIGDGVLVVDASGKPGGFVLTSGLTSPTAAHIHQGARGSPGSIIVPLTGGPALWVVPDGQGALTAAQQAAFTGSGLYYNVHTSANAGGEIRGQLDRGGTPRLAILDASQETPATSSAGFGAGVLVVDDGSSGELGGFLVTVGLDAPTNAHVHGPGPRGSAAAVIVPLQASP